MKGQVYIGTSGWSYKSWEKTFYPPGVRPARHFEYYATQFPTVEINLTFYRLPTPEMVKGWRAKAPPGFIYAVKGSRFITHMNKLANLDGALDKFFARIKPLKKQTGVILWQLPPMLRNDPARLESFLRKLPRTYQHAVEFRHPSWLQEQTFQILRRYGIAHVSVSSLAMPMVLEVTSGLVYIRFHGLEGGAAHNYTREELLPWATHIKREARNGKQVFVYFNNDANVRAPANALMLLEMTGTVAVPSFARAA
jgi:uncharacterized protein YecE (DUF72 family)